MNVNFTRCITACLTILFHLDSILNKILPFTVEPTGLATVVTAPHPLESQSEHPLSLARLHEVHRAIVVTSVVRVYVYVYVCIRVRVTLSVKVFYKSISLDHVDGSS